MSDERSECCGEKLGDFVTESEALYLQPTITTAVTSAIGDHRSVVPDDCQESGSGLKRRADHDAFDVSEQFMLDAQGDSSKIPRKTTVVGFAETAEQLPSGSQNDFCNSSDICHCSTQNDLDCHVEANSCRPDDTAKVSKDDVDPEDAPSDLLSNLRRVFSTSADTAEYFDPYRPRGGRPRGNIDILKKLAVLRDMNTGPPNTTNATKHLRSRHKNEYMMYFELIERFKRGTFFGDLHQSIRELVLKSGVKADAMDNIDGDVNRPVLDIASPESGTLMQRPWPEETAGPSQESDIQSILSAALTSPNLRKSFSREPNMSAESSTVTSSGEAGASTSLQPHRNVDTGVGTIDNVASVGGEFVEQVEAFLRGYRQLETECRRLRRELAARDDQIKNLRMKLLEEQGKRKNALIMVQRALLDESPSI